MDIWPISPIFKGKRNDAQMKFLNMPPLLQISKLKHVLLTLAQQTVIGRLISHTRLPQELQEGEWFFGCDNDFDF